MKDFKEQLEKWRSGQVTEADAPSEASPNEAPPEIHSAPQTDLDASPKEPQELTEADRLLFFEAVVGLGVQNQKPRTEPQDEVKPGVQEAEAAVAELEAADRDLFLREAMKFDAQDVQPEPPSVAEQSAGVAQPSIVRRVMRGAETPNASCDLHGLTREEASKKLEIALSQCHQFGSELLLVIHGKGQGALQEQTVIDLNASKWVGTHFSAPNRLGGEGARVVVLRKRKK